ncbi:MAG: DUF1674 domain-containing protein [Alphaproteobacteria bacterium]|nr:DUF1674 domain-containing protein [Alphaproteobacteria bacterium]
MSAKKPSPETDQNDKNDEKTLKPPVKERGGFADMGLKEPTRFGDWEVRGRCSDF